jgi:hypothetical protein
MNHNSIPSPQPLMDFQLVCRSTFHLRTFHKYHAAIDDARALSSHDITIPTLSSIIHLTNSGRGQRPAAHKPAVVQVILSKQSILYFTYHF